MTAVLTPRPLQLFAEPGAERTLDDVLCDTWESLAAAISASCPVCGGELRREVREPDAHVVDGSAARLRGCCTGCGSTLS